MFDDGPIIEMPPSFNQSIPRMSIEKVSILKSLLKIYLALVKDEDVLAELSTLLEQPYKDLQ